MRKLKYFPMNQKGRDIQGLLDDFLKEEYIENVEEKDIVSINIRESNGDNIVDIIYWENPSESDILKSWL